MSHPFEHSSFTFYADENKNLIFIPYSKNPDYDEDREKEKELAWEKHRQDMAKQGKNPPPCMPDPEREYLSAQHANVLQHPYTPEDVLAACLQCRADVDKYPPYKDKKKDDMQLYLGIGSFREATYGKRLILANWQPCDLDRKISVSVLLPCKAPYQWLGVARIILPPETATPIAFAEAMIELATGDLTEYSGFKTYRRSLNLTPPKPRKKKD